MGSKKKSEEEKNTKEKAEYEKKLMAFKSQMGVEPSIGQKLDTDLKAVEQEIAANEAQIAENAKKAVIGFAQGLAEGVAQKVSGLNQVGMEKVKTQVNKEVKEGKEFVFAQGVAEVYVQEFLKGKIGDKPKEKLQALTKSLEALHNAKDAKSQVKAQQAVKKNAEAFFNALVDKKTGLSKAQRKILQNLLEKELSALSQGKGVVVSAGEAAIKYRGALATCMKQVAEFYLEKNIKEAEEGVKKAAKNAGLASELEDFKSALSALDNTELTDEEAEKAKGKLWSAMGGVAEKAPGIAWKKGVGALGVEAETKEREELKSKKAELMAKKLAYDEKRAAFEKGKEALNVLPTHEEKMLHLRLATEGRATIEKEKAGVELQLAQLEGKKPQERRFLTKKVTQKNLTEQKKPLEEKKELYEKVLKNPVFDAVLLPESKSRGFSQRKRSEVELSKAKIEAIKKGSMVLEKEIEELNKQLGIIEVPEKDKKQQGLFSKAASAIRVNKKEEAAPLSSVEKENAKLDLDQKTKALKLKKVEQLKLEQKHTNMEKDLNNYKPAFDKKLEGIDSFLSEYGAGKIKVAYAQQKTHGKFSSSLVHAFKAVHTKGSRAGQLDELEQAFLKAKQIREDSLNSGQEIKGTEEALEIIRAAVDKVNKEIQQEKPGLNSRLFELTKEITKQLDEMQPAAGPKFHAAKPKK